jgi:hypothetical protein
MGHVEKITYCSSPKIQLWFDPAEMWDIKTRFPPDILRTNLRTGLDAYRKAMSWLTWAFIFATILTAAQISLCPFASSWRVGSIIIYILWIVGCLFRPSQLKQCVNHCQASSISAIVAATMATAAYGVLNGLLHTVFKTYAIETSMGRDLLLILWLGVTAGVIPGPLWLLSVCCC